MAVLWWLICTVLLVLSSVLLVAGLRGKAGILRIGKVDDPSEAEGVPNAERRSAYTSNVAVGIVGIVVGIAAPVMLAL